MQNGIPINADGLTRLHGKRTFAVGAETTCPRCTTDDYALLALKAVQICSHRQGLAD
jgi:hypothetical protein